MKLKFICVLSLMLLMVACSSDGNKSTPRAVDLAHAANIVIATDHAGFVNVYAVDHDGKNLDKFGEVTDAKTPLFHFQVEKVGLPGELITSYGEMHFAEHHNKLIIVTNDSTQHRDSALVIVDIKEAIELGANGDSVAPAVQVVPMPSTKTFTIDAPEDPGVPANPDAEKINAPTRLVHGYLDHSGDIFWINNDGARTPITFLDKEGNTQTMTDGNNKDSTFRVDISVDDPVIAEVQLGSGHKKGAVMSQPGDGSGITTSLTNLPSLFAAHSGGGRYDIVSDNADPQVLDTIYVSAKGAPNAELEGFHGMASSRVNGKIYVGSTRSSLDANCGAACAAQNVALSVYDVLAQNTDAIPNGRNAGEVPASGYVKAAHDEERIYTFGWIHEENDSGQPVLGQGYLSVINSTGADVNGIPDSRATAVVPLGNISASSIDVVDLEGGESKVYVPGAVRGCFGRATMDDLTQGERDVDAERILVVHMDANGDPKAGMDPTEIRVGSAPCHRNGEVSHDNSIVVYPDGCRDAPVPEGFHCDIKTVKVIATKTDTVVQELETHGDHPRSVAIVPADAVIDASGHHQTE